MLATGKFVDGFYIMHQNINSLRNMVLQTFIEGMINKSQILLLSENWQKCDELIFTKFNGMAIENFNFNNLQFVWDKNLGGNGEFSTQIYHHTNYRSWTFIASPDSTNILTRC